MEFQIKSPILGFEQIHKMSLESFAKDENSFWRLVSRGEENICFTLVNPYALRTDYEFEIPAPTRVLLELEYPTNQPPNNTDLLTFNIMLLQEPIENSTVNFLAPLLFNVKNQTMAQVVLESFKYPHFSLSDPISNYLNQEK